MDSADHSTLRARPGDRLVVRGHHQGEPERDAEVLEVLGEDGAPPYRVRWEDGHESEVFPGSDVFIQHLVGPASGIDEDRARELLCDALAAQLREELDAIERAEARLREGTYGLSVESGEPIPAGRLEAIPWAERTAEEQERLE